MVESDKLEMDALRISSHRVVDTMTHSQSTTNMSKSISGTSLASALTTQRTTCNSEFSSVGSSTRGAGSSVPHTPGPNRSSLSEHEDIGSAVLAPPRAARGGGNTVLGGVAPTMQGVLRRRARFSGWRAETGYFEVRSTALIAFSTSKGGGAGGHHHVSLASLAHRIMHPQQQHNQKQAGDWSWSVDIAGAERVVELPALSRKGMFAFAVEFGGSLRRRSIVLSANSAEERTKWINALDRARHRVVPSVRAREKLRHGLHAPPLPPSGFPRSRGRLWMGSVLAVSCGDVVGVLLPCHPCPPPPLQLRPHVPLSNEEVRWRRFHISSSLLPWLFNCGERCCAFHGEGRELESADSIDSTFPSTRYAPRCSLASRGGSCRVRLRRETGQVVLWGVEDEPSGVMRGSRIDSDGRRLACYVGPFQIRSILSVTARAGRDRECAPTSRGRDSRARRRPDDDGSCFRRASVVLPSCSGRRLCSVAWLGG